MSYTNFQSTNQTYSFLLEIDFQDGNGFVDQTSRLLNISIVQEPADDAIAGLITTEAELILLIPTPDSKYLANNLEARVYVTSNGFQELLFRGRVSKPTTFEGDFVYLNLANLGDITLNKNLGTNTNDRWSYSPLVIPGNNNLNYGVDVEFLPTLTYDESVATRPSNGQYRPSASTVGNPSKTDTQCVFTANDRGYFGTNQMLKAIGTFGGYDKDGNFRLKKRWWEDTNSDYDLTNLEFYDSFKSVNLSSNYAFNSIEVQGVKFNHYLNYSPFIESSQNKISEEINNYEVEANSTEDNILSNNNILVAGKDEFPGVSRLVVAEDESGSPAVNKGVHLSSKAYTNSLFFNGSTTYISIPASGSFTTNVWDSLTMDYAIEAYIRPSSVGDLNVIFSTQNTTAGEGIHFGINRIKNRLRLEHGGVATVYSNNNAFKLNEWQHVCVILRDNEAIFLVNGIFWGRQSISPANINTTDKSASIGRRNVNLSSNRRYFHGRIQEVKIKTGFSLTGNDIKEYSKITAPSSWFGFNNSTLGTPNKGFVGYFRLNEGTGTTINNSASAPSNQSQYPNGTIQNSHIWSSLSPDELRTHDDPTLNFLLNFSSDEFTQSTTFNVKNETNKDVYVKRLAYSAKGLYQKKGEIKETASNIPANSFEAKKEYKSFYINEANYAQTLANTFLDMFNDFEGFYYFSVPIQPRLMVGDIITINTKTETNIKCLVLEKVTDIGVDSFRVKDNLKVKRLIV